MTDAPTRTFSKSRVNLAGRFLRKLRVDIREMGNDTFNEHYRVADITEAVTIVEWWRGLHARPLARVNANLRHYIRKVGAEPEVTQRLKRFATMVHKLEREPTMALTTMEDIGGVRAILPTQQQVFDVCEMLDRRWKIHRRRYYVKRRDPGPKDDGYRAVHFVVAKDGCFIEVQLRTPGQDTWAQSVEQDTRRLRADLKFGAGPDDLREYYRMVAEYVEMLDEGVEPPAWFMEDLAKLYAGTRAYFPQDAA